MKLLQKLKYVLRARKPLSQLASTIGKVKSGWKTPGFWITILASLGSIVAAFVDVIPNEMALFISTGIAMAYNILRGLYKAEDPTFKPSMKSSEVWVGILSQVSVGLLALKEGGIQAEWLVASTAAITTATAIARDLSNVEPKDAVLVENNSKKPV